MIDVGAGPGGFHRGGGDPPGPWVRQTDRWPGGNDRATAERRDDEKPATRGDARVDVTTRPDLVIDVDEVAEVEVEMTTIQAGQPDPTAPRYARVLLKFSGE